METSERRSSGSAERTAKQQARARPLPLSHGEDPLGSITAQLQTLLGVDAAALLWWHETARALVIADIAWKRGIRLNRKALPLAAAYEALHNKLPIFGARGLQDESTRSAGLLSVLAVPIASRDQTYGILAAYHHAPRVIDRKSYEQSRALAQIVATHPQTIAQHILPIVQQDESAAIRETVSQIVRSPSVRASWAALAEGGRRLTGADAAIGISIDERGISKIHTMVLPDNRGLPELREISRRHMVLRTLSTGTFSLQSEVAEFLQGLGLPQDILLRSLVALPVGAKRAPHGVLVLAWARPGSASPSRIAIGESLVAHAAVALELRSTHSELLNKSADFQTSQRRLEFIVRAGRELNESLNVRSVLDRIAQLAVPEIGDFCTVDLIKDGIVHKCAACATKDSERLSWVRDLCASTPPYECDESGLPVVLTTAISESYSNVPQQLNQCSDERQSRPLRLLNGIGMKSSLSVKMMSHGQVLGIITVGSTESNAFGDMEALVFDDFASRAARALEHANMYERERNVANVLQNALLPSELHPAQDVRLEHLYEPAPGTALIGGDWYDAFPVGEHKLGLSIGDVAGHGVGSAVTMNVVRQSIRSIARESSDPQYVLTHVNGLLKLEPHPFVTCIYGIVDTRQWTFRYAIAGHTPPIIVQGRDAVSVLPFGGVPLGLGVNHWPTVEVPLRPQDVLILYTDGVVEFSHDIKHGEERFHNQIRSLANRGELSASTLLARTVDGSKTSDDVAILIVRVEGAPALDVTVPAQPENCSLLRHRLRQFLDLCPLSEDQRFDLIVACGEAITNAIEHPEARSSHDVRMRARMSPTRVTVRIEDTGRWRRSEFPPHRGRGIPLMHALVSDVKLWTDHGGTIVELSQSFPALVAPIEEPIFAATSHN